MSAGAYAGFTRYVRMNRVLPWNSMMSEDTLC